MNYMIQGHRNEAHDYLFGDEWAKEIKEFPKGYKLYYRTRSGGSSHTDYYLYGHASGFSFDSVSENFRKDINSITERARGGLRIPTVIYMGTLLVSPSTLFPPS
jgi:Transcription-silencing protein, cryptic loci regulator Clr2